MKIKALIPILFMILASCGSRNEGSVSSQKGSKDRDVLLIDGSIDESFNGQKIYFCPQPMPTADIVDSTVVKRGHFKFSVPADSCYIADITVSKKAPGYAERILIAVEPGTLNVKLGTPSTASGTPKNDILQGWKEFLQSSENQEDVVSRTYGLILENHDFLGGYLYFIFGKMLSEEQIAALDSLGYDSLLPDVSTRK